VEDVSELLDTPSKRTLWRYIVPLLSKSHQSFCQDVLGLPRHTDTVRGNLFGSARRRVSQRRWFVPNLPLPVPPFFLLTPLLYPNLFLTIFPLSPLLPFYYRLPLHEFSLTKLSKIVVICKINICKTFAKCFSVLFYMKPHRKCLQNVCKTFFAYVLFHMWPLSIFKPCCFVLKCFATFLQTS